MGTWGETAAVLLAESLSRSQFGWLSLFAGLMFVVMAVEADAAGSEDPPAPPAWRQVGWLQPAGRWAATLFWLAAGVTLAAGLFLLLSDLAS